MIRTFLYRYHLLPSILRFGLSFIFWGMFISAVSVAWIVIVQYLFKCLYFQIFIHKFDFKTTLYTFYFIMFLIPSTSFYFILRIKSIEIRDFEQIPRRASAIERTGEQLSDLLQQLISAISEYDERNHELTTEVYSKRRLWREIADISPYFVFAKDSEGRFFIINKSLADCYGVHPKILYGKTDYDFNARLCEVDGFTADDREVIETQQPRFNIIEKITCSDGRIRILRTNKIPIRTWDNDSPAVLGMAEDITEEYRCFTENGDIFSEIHCGDKWDVVIERMRRLAEKGYHD